ncbi:MAG TPA: hypothetical protein DCS48_00695 [Desulfovibrio sp.]|nr:hypothetical protein [Desulfovibrio sp.]
MSIRIESFKDVLEEMELLHGGIDFLAYNLPKEEPIGSLDYILSLFADRMSECNRALKDVEIRRMNERRKNEPDLDGEKSVATS